MTGDRPSAYGESLLSDAEASKRAAARLANRDQFPPPVTVLRSGGEALRGHAGPLEYRPDTCQALVEDGTQSCAVRATWRVTVQDCDAASWLICQPHLGETIMLADDTYGGPVLLVTRYA